MKSAARQVHPVVGNVETLAQRHGDRDQRTVLQGRGDGPDALRRSGLQGRHQGVQGHAREHGGARRNVAVLQLHGPIATLGANLDDLRVQARSDSGPHQGRRRSFPELTGTQDGVPKEVVVGGISSLARPPIDRPDALGGPIACDVVGAGQPGLADVAGEEQLVPVAPELPCPPLRKARRRIGGLAAVAHPGPPETAKPAHSAAQPQLCQQLLARQRVAHVSVVDEHRGVAASGAPLRGRKQLVPQVQHLLALGEEPVSTGVDAPAVDARRAGQATDVARRLVHAGPLPPLGQAQRSGEPGGPCPDDDRIAARRHPRVTGRAAAEPADSRR